MHSIKLISLTGSFRVLLPFLFISCNTQTSMIYETTYNGQAVTVKNIIKKRLFSTKLSQTIQWGKLKALDISEFTTNTGMPYSDDIYGDAPRVYTDTPASGGSNKIKVMLYLPPREYSPEEFEQYAAFMRSGWQEIKDKIVLDQGYRVIDIGGIVYGNDIDFEQVFRNDDNKKITIKTNGDIFYGDDNSVESVNLSATVQMPGKIIRILKGGALNRDNLRNYKNKSGKSPETCFSVEEE
ncbi:hypothetical protein [Agriterribacter sp.]|uniref:hypothetical protein n=1 Tax=Agriterribacter sp. TaxID=2821509 RepID=UPI002C622105|nr:hypothetical protein [Agriterribacter sp.]HRP55539.1 hypothetical protein [Agriterribacter sp.]